MNPDIDQVRVLVVDDYPDSLRAMAALLESPDRQIVTAASGEEALRHLLQGDYAVVLLDVKMAGIDGYETAALIRERKKTRETPIIFLTSNNKEVHHVAKGYSHGAVDYLFKPFPPEILRSKVDVFVELAKKTVALTRQNAELERAKKELAERASELARSNADLERFAYLATHDLKEPLRMVSDYVKLLANRYKDRPDVDASDLIDFSEHGVDRMERLISDVLAYSRVGGQRESQIVDCEKVLAGAIARLGSGIRNSEALITHDPLPTVQGDEGELARVFQSLVGNAIKFRRGHGSRIHVSAERPPSPMESRDEWVFSVQDDGIGIERINWDRIFHLFQRLHSQAEYEGSGVGLALCKRIVEAHCGRIWLDSEVGKGSTFYFTLPAGQPG
jgi:two-component system, sensor histidine kinase and response regulator